MSLRICPIRIAVTGGPGSGKTFLIRRLQRQGYMMMPEVAREIIADRIARGLSPRPPPLEFAQAIFERDIEQYNSVATVNKFVFFDRSILDSLGMLSELDQLTHSDMRRLLAQYPYHSTAFILPPWREIYHVDSERDQNYEEAVNIYQRLHEWYIECGYMLSEVPPGSIAERCAFVSQCLEETGMTPNNAVDDNSA